MPIRVTCPSCSRSLRVPDRLAVGLGVKVPRACLAQFTAEESSGADYSDYRPAGKTTNRSPARKGAYSITMTTTEMDETMGRR